MINRKYNAKGSSYGYIAGQMAYSAYPAFLEQSIPIKIVQLIIKVNDETAL